MNKFGFSNILKQAQKIQEEIQKVQTNLENIKVEGSSGGGMVTVVANGKQEIIKVKIEKEVVNSDDVEMLEDLIVAAVNNALQKSQETANEEMKKATGGLIGNIDLSNLKIPGL